jgi:transposase
MSDPLNSINSGRRGSQSYSDEFKRRLVAASNQPGASLSSVAQENKVSVSALSNWRRQFQLPMEPDILIPIAVEPTLASSTVPDELTFVPNPSSESPATGLLEIILEQATIRVTGAIDTGALRVVLEGLRGC